MVSQEIENKQLKVMLASQHPDDNSDISDLMEDQQMKNKY